MPPTAIPVCAKRSRYVKQVLREIRSERRAIPVRQEKQASKDQYHAVHAQRESLQNARDPRATSVLLDFINPKTISLALIVLRVLKDGDQY